MAGIGRFPLLRWRSLTSAPTGANLFFVVDRLDDFVAFDKLPDTFIQQHKHRIRRNCAYVNFHEMNWFPYILSIPSRLVPKLMNCLTGGICTLVEERSSSVSIPACHS